MAAPGSAERQEFFDQAGSFTELVEARTADGQRCLVSTRDQAVGKRLFAGGRRFEHVVLARAIALLGECVPDWTPARKVFLDVGANIGTTTIDAVARHGFAGAVALEPEPGNLRVLRANAALNGLERQVRALGMGASDVPGTADLLIHGRNSGGHRLSLKDAGETGSEHVRVDVTTLDTLAARGLIDPERAGMLWIDVQGHEGHVLAGAQRLTALRVPIVAEYQPPMLEKTGGLELFRAAVAGYTHVADLRGEGAGAQLTPIDELERLTRDLGGGEGPDFTDLLVVAC